MLNKKGASKILPILTYTNNTLHLSKSRQINPGLMHGFATYQIKYI
jgi:hypothetical protein